MFNLKTLKLSLPELPVFTMKSDYSHHVRNSTPEALAAKAWGQSNAALNKAVSQVGYELVNEQKAKATK